MQDLPAPLWDLDVLKQDVRACFGAKQLSMLRESLKSLINRRRFARFHFSEARKLMRHYQAETDMDKVQETFWMGEDDSGNVLEADRTLAEAHVVACVQSLHAVADTMAYTIYLSMGLGQGTGNRPYQPSQVNLKSLEERLSSAHLRDCLSEWRTDPELGYLDALCNHGKHRSIVTAGYCIDLSSERHGLQFAEFAFKDQSYAPRWVDEALIEISHRQEGFVMRVGLALNHELRIHRESMV